MSPSSFFLLAGILIFGSLLVLLLGRPSPKPPPAKKEPQPRWTLYVLHLGNLWGGKGPAIERPGTGFKLSPSGAVASDFRSLALVDDQGGAAITLDRKRRFGRESLRIRLGREGFGEVRSARRGGGPPEVILREGVPLALAEAGDTVEIRRGATLVAQASPGIAGAPDAVGVEILATEEPLPVLGLVTAHSILRRTLSGKSAGA